MSPVVTPTLDDVFLFVPFPTLTLLKMRLGIPPEDTSQDLNLVIVMSATVAIIEKYLGRGIVSAHVTQTFTEFESRNPYLLLNRFPVDTVNSVTVNGVVQDPSTYSLRAEHGVLRWRSRCCAPSYQYCAEAPEIVVDFQGGYPDSAWPADLVDAVMRAFSARWKATAGDPLLPIATAPIKSVNVDGFAVTYGEISSGMGELDDEVTPVSLIGVTPILDPYRQRLVTGI